MTEDIQTVPMHLEPEIARILAIRLPVQKVHPGCLNEEGELTLGELIDEKRDIYYDEQAGKGILKLGGVLSILVGIGAEQLELKAERTAPYEYHVVQGVRFADGSVFYSTGEASDRNVERGRLSGAYPLNQAEKRGLTKALIRGLGLYSVLFGEEEAEEFKHNRVRGLEEKHRQEMDELFLKYKGTLEDVKAKHAAELAETRANVSGFMEEALSLLTIPADDPVYPLRLLVDVAEDEAYLTELADGERGVLAYAAKQLLKKQAAEPEEGGDGTVADTVMEVPEAEAGDDAEEETAAQKTAMAED